MPETNSKEPISADELIRRLSDYLGACEGETLAELHNEWYPTEPVKYLGDSLFEFEGSGVEAVQEG